MNSINDPDPATGKSPFDGLRILQIRIHPRFRVDKPRTQMFAGFWPRNLTSPSTATPRPEPGPERSAASNIVGDQQNCPDSSCRHAECTARSDSPDRATSSHPQKRNHVCRPRFAARMTPLRSADFLSDICRLPIIFAVYRSLRHRPRSESVRIWPSLRSKPNQPCDKYGT